MGKIDLNILEGYLNKKLISKQKHDTLDLYIWNYTPKAQFDRVWDEYTTLCRGLITDLGGNIKAQPFKKFWNYEEHSNGVLPQLPNEPFRVLEKLDGSLGILYRDTEGVPFLATRGSFNSEQAITGTRILRSKYHDFPFNSKWTYLFEIIYKQNRIVVDYGGMEDLVLLAIVNTDTGEDIVESVEYPFPVAQSFSIGSIEEMQHQNRPNCEGYVIQFIPSGIRAKIKHEEYIRLHRLLTGFSSKSIWELLKNGQSFDKALENVPDEFMAFVRSTRDKLELQYAEIVNEAQIAIKQVPQAGRAEQAGWIKGQTNPHLLFALLDGRSISEMVWRMIKPKYEQPFVKDIDL